MDLSHILHREFLPKPMRSKALPVRLRSGGESQRHKKGNRSISRQNFRRLIEKDLSTIPGQGGSIDRARLRSER